MVKLYVSLKDISKIEQAGQLNIFYMTLHLPTKHG